MNRPPGIILAGGLSTRMGGGNKGLRVLAGETLLSRVIRRLTPQCAPLAINANGAPDVFDDYDLPVISDGFAGLAGPLAGVLAGMEWAEALGAEVVRLDMTRPFTAARARNAGLALVAEADFIQFVDGDCVLDPGWIPVSTAFLEAHPDVAVACGRRR